MTTILSIDPGKTTGLVSIDTERDPFTVLGAQVGPANHHIDLWALMCEGRYDIIVCESFQHRTVEISTGVQAPGIELISRNYIGVVELFCSITGTQLTMQTPMNVVGKNNFWSDDKLKQVGGHTKGRPHRNDATRHLLYFLTMTLKRREYVNLLRSEEDLRLTELQLPPIEPYFQTEVASLALPQQPE